MGNNMLRIVGQVGIFMICAQMILHFKPAESYGKYIRLLISVMVLVQLIVPAMKLFGKTGEDVFQERILFYEDILLESMEEINITGAAAESMLEEMTMEEVKTRINNQNTETAAPENKIPEEGGATPIQINRIEVNAGD